MYIYCTTNNLNHETSKQANKQTNTRKNLVLLVFLLVSMTSNTTIFGQNYIINLHDDIVQPLSENEGSALPTIQNCLDVEDIVYNCTPVWIAVNVHVFLDDNCEGNIAISDGAFCQDCDLTAENVDVIIEDFIHRANQFAENISDNIPWTSELIAVGQDPTTATAQCFPYRLLLKGIHVHCNLPCAV